MKRALRKLGSFVIALLFVVNMFSYDTVMLAQAQSNYSDLIFSEYIEGGSNNKALEIYNGTGSDIDLSKYSVVLYSNANITPGNTVTLSGTLGDGNVFVIGNSSADAAILALSDILSNVTYFNGNDAVVLYKDYDASSEINTVVDSIGKIGGNIDYVANDVSTKDMTLVRITAVADTDPTNDYDPSVDFVTKGKDIFTFLGAHEAIISTDPSLFSIKDARTKTIGDVVEVEGIVTNLEKRIFIQNVNGEGICLYTGDVTGVAVGDKVKVSGTLGEYKSLLQISPFVVESIISSGNTLPTEQLVTVEGFNEEEFEAERVFVENIKIIEQMSFGDYKAVDVNDETKIIWIDPQEGSLDDFLEVGKIYKEIHGIANVHYDQLEIMPLEEAGIIAESTPVDPIDPVDPAYYNGVEGLTGDALKAKLNDIITLGHDPVSYDEAYTALEYTDADPFNSDNIILFYKGVSIDGGNRLSDDGDIWNREHVWAKSHGDFGTATGPGSDLHQLRPTDASVNSLRGHLDFDESDNPVIEAPANSYDDDSFEPRDEVKGDVARALFYMATRYEGEEQYVDLELSESLDSISATTGSYGEHGKLTTLLIWNELDPVDDFELQRNNVVEDYQGNRNPYIDHPEFVSLIWGEGTIDPVDPSEMISITEARTKATDSEVFVKGVVTHTESGTSMYIQDDADGIKAGIKLDTYDSKIDLNIYSIGQQIEVKGVIGAYKGEVLIKVGVDGITVVEPAALPSAEATTLLNLKAGLTQGMLVSCDTLKVTGVSAYSIDVMDIDNQTIDIYHAKADNFDSTSIVVGDWYNVVGIASWYDNEQIKLRDGSEFVSTTAPVNPNSKMPIILDAAPANMSSTYNTDLTVSFKVEATENPIDETSAELIVDGVLVSSEVVDSVVEAEMTGLSLGRHTAKAVIKDILGNETTDDWYFEIIEDVEYDFYYGIPHSHTSFSDGKGTPTEAFTMAKANGLDWLFTTDHSNWYDGVKFEQNTSLFADVNSAYYDASYDLDHEMNTTTNQYEEKAGSEWARTRVELEAFNAANPDFIGFRGFEMTFSDVGHINIIDSDAYVEAKSQMSNLTEFYDWVDNLSESQDEVTLAAFNHPNWPSDSFYNQAYVPNLDDEFTMMEVGNGAPPYSYARSEEQFIRALDNGWHLGATNGQDNHSTNWGVGDNLTAIIAADLSSESLKEAVMNRRIYSTETRNLELSVKANGYWMGSVVNVQAGEDLNFEIEASDNEEPIASLQIMTNGGIIIDEKVFDTPVTTATWNPVITVPGGANWYVVKVIHEEGQWGTASPIFTPEADNDVKFTKLEVNPNVTLPGFETELRATVANMGLRGEENIEVKFYENTVTDSNLIGTSMIDSLAAGDSVNTSVTWTPTVDGETTIIAIMTEILGVTTVTEITTTASVVPANGKKILVDASHGNYDVPGGIGEFITLTRMYGYNTVVNSSPITESLLNDVDLFVATQPRGTFYTDAEETVLGDWVQAGGSVMLAAKSNYSDDSTELNDILEAAGSDIRFNDDNVYEPEGSAYYNGGMVWSVYAYNLPETISGINENMEAIRMFSSASLVAADGGPLTNNDATGLEILLAGNDSSYNYSVGKQTGGGYTYNLEGELNGETIPMIAKEDIGLGHVAATGRHFFSDFEIGNEVSNTALTLKLVDYLADYNRIKTIADVRQEFANGTLNLGDTVTVKGTAIVDEEVLFEVIYIQDETSGISLYGSYQDNPSDVLEGVEVIATGTIAMFEGEMELAYKTFDTDVIYVGMAEKKIAMTIKTSELSNQALQGMLVNTVGKITEINEAGSFMNIDDGSGVAYIHVDGYVGVDMTNFSVGDIVSVTGVASHGAAGYRIRVRYETDIVEGEIPFTTAVTIVADETKIIRKNNTTVSFTISLKDITNINAFDGIFSYNDDVLIFKNAEIVSDLAPEIIHDKNSNTIRVIGGTFDPVTSEDYQVIKLNFKLVSSNDEPAIAIGEVGIVDFKVADAETQSIIIPKVTNAAATVQILADLFDVNLDGELNILDISFALVAYLGTEDDDNWDEIKYADVNNDLIIDVLDLAMIMKNVSKK